MLITCPECGSEVSDKADKCIKCGCPIFQSKTKAILEIHRNNKLGGLFVVPWRVVINQEIVDIIDLGQSCTITRDNAFTAIVEENISTPARGFQIRVTPGQSVSVTLAPGFGGTVKQV